MLSPMMPLMSNSTEEYPLKGMVDLQDSPKSPTSVVDDTSTDFDRLKDDVSSQCSIVTSQGEVGGPDLTPLLPSLEEDLRAVLKNMGNDANNEHPSSDSGNHGQSDDVTTTGASPTKGQVDQQIRTLMEINLPASCVESSALEAVRFMMPRNIRNGEELIILGAKLYFFQHNRNPRGRDLLSLLIDAEFSEDIFIQKYIELNRETVVEKTSNTSSAISSEQADNTETYTTPAFSTTLLPALPASLTAALPPTVSPTLQVTLPETLTPTVPPATLPTQPTVQIPKTVKLTKKQRSSALAAVMRRERELLVASTKCVSCKTKPREVTFLPCGHYSMCSSCADKTSTCPVCKTNALAEVRTFLV